MGHSPSWLHSVIARDLKRGYMSAKTILSIPRTWTRVILVEKSNSRRHSTTGFGENLSVAETSYQILEGNRSFIIWDRNRAFKTSFNKNNHDGISGKNKAFWSVYFLGIREKKNFTSKLVLESKRSVLMTPASSTGHDRFISSKY